MTRKFNSLEEAFEHLSADVTRLSGEVLAANVLAAAALRRLGADAAVAAEARDMLAQVRLIGGDADENARLMEAAHARLDALLGDLYRHH